jgi:hypothetical protein
MARHDFRRATFALPLLICVIRPTDRLGYRGCLKLTHDRAACLPDAAAAPRDIEPRATYVGDRQGEFI